MPRCLTALMLTTTLFLLLATRAPAESAPCLSEPDLTAALERQFQEKPLASALTSAGVLLLIHVSADGSWTITASRLGGPACIIASGSDFNLLHRDGLFPSTDT